MSMSAAVEKARSLHTFVMSQGAPLNEFALTLTDAEALDLLDPLKAGELGHFGNHEQLEIDIEEAKRRHDPWLVLEHFTIFGLEIRRAQDVLQ